MKRRNMNKTIMQRGGLMIEALAMLGLIAVVTPTMYKKSAERTMEVEDINTASTIRTVMNAANDFVSSNYSTLISEMNKSKGTAATVRTISDADINAFLPYGFNLSSALRNYGEPTMKVVRPDKDSNNLTAFVVFPAKADADDGIGQERTSRIAALVGSNGGYKPTDDTARGVGGIWSLDAEKFGKVFGSNIGKQYSIVTASTDIINSATNNEVDMTKYLQRGKDADGGTEWKNTMRTDLYMGGPNADGDIYKDQTGPYSILNIKSLIVGTDTAPEEGNYGLYLAEGADNPNAYVHGSLEAGDGRFKADSENLAFGTGADTWNFLVDTAGHVMNKGNLNLASDNGVWNDIKIGALRNNGANKYLIRGSKTAATLPEGSGGGIGAPFDYGSLTFMDDLMKLTDASNDEDKKVKIMENGWAKDENGNAYGDIKYVRSIASTDPSHPTQVPVPEFPVEIDANTKVKGLLTAGQIDTNKIRTASLSVGSEYINDKYQWMTVDKKGVLIADPSDRDGDTKTKNRININKDQIVLSVDKNAKEVTNPRGKDATDGHETSAHDAQIIMNAKNTVGTGDDAVSKAASIEIKAPNVAIHGDSTTVSGKGTLIQAGSDISDFGVTGNNLDNNRLLLRNDNMQISMTAGETVTTDEDGKEHRTPNDTAETVIGPRNAANNYKIRTVFDKGNVALVDSNLNVLNENKLPVFSVGTNGKSDGFPTPYADIYTVAAETSVDAEKKIKTIGSENRYDIAAHGNIVFTENNVPSSFDEKGNERHTYLSMGDSLNKFAAVNILAVTLTSGPSWDIEDPQDARNIVMIDQGASNQYKKNSDGFYTDEKVQRNKRNLAEPGTIYIRKGYLEAVGSVNISDLTGVSTYHNDAKTGNGVIVASRFVANNPNVTNRDNNYGANFANFVSKSSYENPRSGKLHQYDTYMVNPAYTSVMHDIKLTTRGGARLSDVLPDFINKGIYVVSNTYEEIANDSLTFNNWPNFCPTTRGSGSSATVYDLRFGDGACNRSETADGYYKNIKTISLGKSWASPFLGVVPAPQCPPGYGRVITLTPSSFELGLAGQLKKADGSTRYYVAPTTSISTSDVADSVNKEASFAQASVQAVKVKDSSPSMTISGDIGGVNAVNSNVNVSNLEGINTAEYVLTTGTGSNLKPLVVQQSTRLKSMVKPIYSDTDSNYVRGWATIMGFLYLNNYYTAFGTPDNTSYTWNVFPVMPNTIEGYATVYCYFDRTNMFKDYSDASKYYVDPYNYMVNMQLPPKSFKKKSKADIKDGPEWKEDKSNEDYYQERLNDPELKYNEVW